jgi:hypothetical protein
VEPLANGLQIVSPAPKDVINMSTVHVVAHAVESAKVSQMQVWDNGVKLGWYAGSDVNEYFSLAPGSHALTIIDLDSNYNDLHQSSVFYTVQ